MRQIILLLFVRLATAQTAPDPGLLRAINDIKAIDNHAHPVQVLAPGETLDLDSDALSSAFSPNFDNLALPVRMRPDNPENIEAWRALYGYPFDDMPPAHVAELLKTKHKVMREQGDNYPEWVLDRLGIETMLANRVALGRGQKPPRFLWVPFDDALLFPLDNSAANARNSNLRDFYGDEERLLHRI